MATELRRRGLDGSLGNGALGFALLESAIAPPRESWSIGDPVEAAAVTVWSPTTTWKPGLPDAGGARRARNADQPIHAAASRRRRRQWRRRTAAAGPRLPDLVDAGRCGAGSRERDAVRVRRPDALSPWTTPRTVRPLLCATDRMSGGSRRLSRRSAPATGGSPLRSRTSAHSTASPRSGCSPSGSAHPPSHCKQPDVALIAASAERWRRTCAGDWAYSSRETIESAWSQAPDASIRGSRCAAAPKQDCLEQIQIWIGATEPSAHSSEPAPEVRGGRSCRATSGDEHRRCGGAARPPKCLRHSCPQWRCWPQPKGRSHHENSARATGGITCPDCCSQGADRLEDCWSGWASAAPAASNPLTGIEPDIDRLESIDRPTTHSRRSSSGSGVHRC